MDVNCDSALLMMENSEMRYLRNAEKSIDLGIKNSCVRLTKHSINKQISNDQLDSEIKSALVSEEECNVKEPLLSWVSCCNSESLDSSVSRRLFSKNWSVSFALPMKKLFMTGQVLNPSEIEDVSKGTNDQVSFVVLYLLCILQVRL